MVVYADDLDTNFKIYRCKPEWLYCGDVRLSETTTGYGKKLTSDYKIRFLGKDYRVYWTCFSNVSSVWFKCKKYGQVFIKWDICQYELLENSIIPHIKLEG